MAHSRLERIGTIYSRISGLIKAGAMSLEDRPLWYDVYKAFPPKYPPQYDRPFPNEPIKPIFYPEDQIRAKFYKALKNSPLPKLDDQQHQTLCQKFITTTNNLVQEQNLCLDEAIEKALHSIQVDIGSKANKLENEKESNTQDNISVNMKEIFS